MQGAAVEIILGALLATLFHAGVCRAAHDLVRLRALVHADRRVLGRRPVRWDAFEGGARVRGAAIAALSRELLHLVTVRARSLFLWLLLLVLVLVVVVVAVAVVVVVIVLLADAAVVVPVHAVVLDDFQLAVGAAV